MTLLLLFFRKKLSNLFKAGQFRLQVLILFGEDRDVAPDAFVHDHPDDGRVRKLECQTGSLDFSLWNVDRNAVAFVDDGFGEMRI